ncbi:MAG: nitroreductase/quinone reductase family protein [Pseudonocardia sp.]|nr:nitroreductase/quinone reductase family protein [Pseudonocardia sp.]
MATGSSAPTSATPPRWLKPMNRVLMALQRLGLGMKELPVLTVPGRRSGEPRRTPVSVLHLDGRRYLLVGYPGADWGRNARAAGRGTLRVGRVVEPVTPEAFEKIAGVCPVFRLDPDPTRTDPSSQVARFGVRRADRRAE